MNDKCELSQDHDATLSWHFYVVDFSIDCHSYRYATVAKLMGIGI